MPPTGRSNAANFPKAVDQLPDVSLSGPNRTDFVSRPAAAGDALQASRQICRRLFALADAASKLHYAEWETGDHASHHNRFVLAEKFVALGSTKVIRDNSGEWDRLIDRCEQVVQLPLRSLSRQMRALALYDCDRLRRGDLPIGVFVSQVRWHLPRSIAGQRRERGDLAIGPLDETDALEAAIRQEWDLERPSDKGQLVKITSPDICRNDEGRTIFSEVTRLIGWLPHPLTAEQMKSLRASPDFPHRKRDGRYEGGGVDRGGLSSDPFIQFITLDPLNEDRSDARAFKLHFNFSPQPRRGSPGTVSGGGAVVSSIEHVHTDSINVRFDSRSDVHKSVRSALAQGEEFEESRVEAIRLARREHVGHHLLMNGSALGNDGGAGAYAPIDALLKADPSTGMAALEALAAHEREKVCVKPPAVLLLQQLLSSVSDAAITDKARFVQLTNELLRKLGYRILIKNKRCLLRVTVPHGPPGYIQFSSSTGTYGRLGRNAPIDLVPFSS